MAALTILTWPDYINPVTLEQFRREFNVELHLEIVPSAIELIERMGQPAPGVDVLVPPDYAVRELAAQGRLARLNHEWLPNLMHLHPKFLRGRPHDPETHVSVIKDWGTTGYMYRTDLVTGSPQSWMDFWRLAEKYSGQVTLLDSPGEVIGAVLKMRGHSYNATSQTLLDQACLDLLAIKPHLLAFETDYKPLLVSGGACLAMGWNGDAASLKGKGIPIRYVIPVEGSQIWEDDWAISGSSTQLRLAHEFLNFTLRPEIAVQEAAYTRYATGNKSGFELLGEAERSDPSTYPADDLLARLEAGLPLNEQGRRARALLWDAIRN